MSILLFNRDLIQMTLTQAYGKIKTN